MTDTVLSDLVHLPLDEIEAAPDNLRTEIGDVSEMAASMKSGGVHSPLTVTGGGMDGKYLLVAGHRRLAAARAAGLSTVPVQIRHYTENERIEAMLVENMERSDLDPMEQARGFARLAELGWSQRKIAERMFGSDKQQGRVSKLLKLVKLPEPAQQKISAGELSLEDARDLADMPAESQKRALQEGDAGSLSWSIRNEKHRLQQAARVKKLESALTKAGVRVLKKQPGGATWLGMTDKAGAKPHGYKDHADPDLGCAVVVLQHASAYWYCTDKKHAPKAPKQQGLDLGNDKRLAELEQAAAARTDALSKLLTAAAHGDLVQHAAVQLIHMINIDAAARLLDLDNDDDKLIAYASESTANATRVICALALGEAEDDLKQLRYRTLAARIKEIEDYPYMRRVDLRRHYQVLVDHGYEPTTEEAAALDPGAQEPPRRSRRG